MRDPREHHSPCGCSHSCKDIEELGVTCRASAMQRLADVRGQAGVAFGLEIMTSIMSAFGAGSLSQGEKQVRCWHLLALAAVQNGHDLCA